MRFELKAGMGGRARWEGGRLAYMEWRFRQGMVQWVWWLLGEESRVNELDGIVVFESGNVRRAGGAGGREGGVGDDIMGGAIDTQAGLRGKTGALYLSVRPRLHVDSPSSTGPASCGCLVAKAEFSTTLIALLYREGGSSVICDFPSVLPLPEPG